MTRLLPLTVLLVACGDTTGATGELGRVRYSIHTTYVVDDRPLNEVLLVTGHEQRFHTELTEDGEKKAGEDAWEIWHRYVPGSGVDVWNEDGDEDDDPDDIPGYQALVRDPGTYAVESVLQGEVFDYLDLTYEKPDGLELLAWVRDRNGDEFELEDVSGPINVMEGAQATFLPIPTNQGERLVGDIVTELSSDPEDAVIRGENVLGVYEQRVASSSNLVNIYFVDSGFITVTITDPVNGISGSVDFDVADVGE